MSSLFVVAILALNFAISWWNAYVCGRAWVESRAVGGWIRFIVWCAAVQSAIGFSSVFIIPLVFIAHHLFPGYYTEAYVTGTFYMWYLLIIIPLLGSGLAITVHSWIVAYRERSLLNIGVAGWNTFADIYNTMQAINTAGTAFDAVGRMFSATLRPPKDSNDVKSTAALIGLLIAICVVALALAAGALLTSILIKRYAATDPLPAAITQHVRAQQAAKA